MPRLEAVSGPLAGKSFRSRLKGRAGPRVGGVLRRVERALERVWGGRGVRCSQGGGGCLGKGLEGGLGGGEEELEEKGGLRGSLRGNLRGGT